VEERGKLLDTEALWVLRQRAAVPVWQRMQHWLESEAVRRVLPKGPMGEALGYLRNQWSAAADSEESSSPVEETLEQAEQRLILEAARTLTDSAREKFVREVLIVTDRAIVDSQAELARRLAELALKVARGSNLPEADPKRHVAADRGARTDYGDAEAPSSPAT
jgi:hypothetical protein